MRVIVFDLAGGKYALELSRVGRILPAPGRREPSAGVIDLGRLLELNALPPVWDAEQGHRVVLGTGEAQVRMGRPLGTAEVPPEWILPLPGYIFKARHGLFRGIIRPPDGAEGGAAEVARLSLLLSHSHLAGERP